MKFITTLRALFPSMFAVLILLTTTSVNSTITSPGAICQPANLQQALALGLGWSQFGLTNNSPLNGGSFFVACPLIIDEDELDDDRITIGIDLHYLDTNSEDVTCTLYSVSTLFGSTTTRNLQVRPNPVAFPSFDGRVSSELELFIIKSDRYMQTVICAMRPQTRIGHMNVKSSGFY